MTTISTIDEHAAAVSARLADIEASPAAETRRLTQQLRERLADNEREQTLHAAETEVLIERARQVTDQRFLALVGDEAAIRADLKRNLEEQDRVRAAGARAIEEITAARAKQLAELTRQDRMLQAALAAAAEPVSARVVEIAA